MAVPPINNVWEHVAQRLREFTGTRTTDVRNCYLDQDLHIDPEDFIELCEDLEETFAIDLRPFFEDGQPERRGWIWTQKVARDVTVGELATHIEELISTRS